ncbi:universal stress protein [uncultured Bartonella sp.]|uniref:universal stress protein n=1 Tax=uncultured Bartonella sp. TaxID=104108 RepID=UPI0025FD5A1A|nr:universal stress protein [uncultured Bartonella sp.]
MKEPILALVDSSIYWKSVCDLALWAAQQFDTPIRLLNVLENMPDDAVIPPDIAKDIDDRFYTDFIGKIRDHSASYARLMQELGQTLLEEAKNYIEERGARDVDTRLRFDSLSDAIKFYGKTSPLIVIGKQGQKTLNKAGVTTVGGNFETIIRASPVPVLAATIDVKPIKKALILYDSEFKWKLITDYFNHFHLFSGKTIVLACSKYASSSVSEDIEELARELENAKIEVSPLLLDDDRDGDNINKIVDENNIDMIILSAFDKDKITSLIYGSFAESLIKKVKVPTLIIGSGMEKDRR